MKQIISYGSALAVLLTCGVCVAQTSPVVPKENVSGLSLMVAAYVALLVLIFGFLFIIMKRQKHVSDDLEHVKAQFDQLFDSHESPE